MRVGPLAFALALSLPALAHADAPRAGFEAALFGGYATNDSSSFGHDGLNLYGVGFGARFGYVLEAGPYVGASLTYHLGFAKDFAGGPATGRVMPFGVEAGWEFPLARATLRPFLGVGAAHYDSSYDAPGQVSKGHGQKPALWPGVVVAYPIAEHLTAGIEGRYTVVFKGDDDTITAAGGGSANGFALFANAAYRF